MIRVENICVFSRNSILEFIQGNPNKKIAVISINGIGEEPPIGLDKQPNVVAFLRLNFPDSEDGMKKEDAEKVGAFLFSSNLLEKIDLLFVHCGAGISRSAGVAAGIMKAIFNDDTAIFNNSYYKPNMNCYRKTLESCMNFCS